MAHGAVAYYLDRLIGSRIAKTTYGIHMQPPYDRHNPLHRERMERGRVYTDEVNGKQYVRGGFAVLVEKVRLSCHTHPFFITLFFGRGKQLRTTPYTPPA